MGSHRIGHAWSDLAALRLPWFAQTVKNLPAIQETQLPSLGWEDRLEEVMATHSSILARRIPWTEEPGRLQSIASQRLGHNWATNTKIHFTVALLERKKEIMWVLFTTFTLSNYISCTTAAAAAAAAKLLQSCPSLCDPIDGSPPVSPVPGIL